MRITGTRQHPGPRLRFTLLDHGEEGEAASSASVRFAISAGLLRR